jgi:hypothetical protein
MYKPRVGDRVYMTDNSDDSKRNILGIIKHISLDLIAFEADEFIHGHHCDGKCKAGHGWFVSSDQLTPAFASDAELKAHKKQQIINKMKYLNTKFENRKGSYDF